MINTKKNKGQYFESLHQMIKKIKSIQIDFTEGSVIS